MREVAMGFDEEEREKLTREWLDRRTEAAASFLWGFNELVKKVDVGDSGKIVVGGKETMPTTGEWQFLRRFEDLLARFEAGNRICAREYRGDPNVVDAGVIFGAVVVVYNSAYGLPVGFSPDGTRGNFGGPTDFWAENERGRAIRLNRLGLITIDLNPDKRKDGVKPGTSLRHELAHHGVAVTDYLTSGEASLWMKSAYRRGRNRALYGNNANRLTTKAAFDADLDKYAVLLNRKEEEIRQRDVEKQLGYLEELYASGMQRKEEWLSAGGVVYNNQEERKGRYWEVVGDHPNDALATKKLLAYLQAAYLCERSIAGGEILVNLMDKMLAIVGAARTVLQAERLVGGEWERFLEREWVGALVASPSFVEWRERVYKSGWGIEGLKDLFSLL